jgi:tripartite-type tricarboxylate transporter receptor subunit TctC
MKRILTAALALLALCSPSYAQEAGRIITIVVPFTAGTGGDVMARLIADELKVRWKQPVVVENRPGATGDIGAVHVARAQPDGLTLLQVGNPFTATMNLRAKPLFDPAKDFEPVLHIGTGHLAITVHPSIPANTLKEFVAYAKARPGKLNYASPGVGGPHHLAMELFCIKAGISMKHVPYKGSAGATTDLIGGHVQAGFQTVHIATPFVKDGKLKMLGIASRKSPPLAETVPTLASMGYPVEADLWYGLAAPRGTPRAIVERYNREVNSIISDPAIVAKLTNVGLFVTGGSPDQLRAFIASDIAKWKAVIVKAGITLNDKETQ